MLFLFTPDKELLIVQLCSVNCLTYFNRVRGAGNAAAVTLDLLASSPGAAAFN